MKQAIRLAVLCTFLWGASVQVACSCPGSKNSGSEASYSFSYSQSLTGSGQATSMIPNLNVTSGRRSLEFGILFQNGNNYLSGLTVSHRVYITPHENNARAFRPALHVVNPYLVYNFFYYRTNVLSETLPSYRQKDDQLEQNRVGAHEHYLGIGFQVKMIEQVYLDMNFGAGYYIGSIDKSPNGPNTLGKHGENSGITYLVRFGLGYYLMR